MAAPTAARSGPSSGSDRAPLAPWIVASVAISLAFPLMFVTGRTQGFALGSGSPAALVLQVPLAGLGAQRRSSWTVSRSHLLAHDRARVHRPLSRARGARRLRPGARGGGGHDRGDRGRVVRSAVASPRILRGGRSRRRRVRRAARGSSARAVWPRAGSTCARWADEPTSADGASARPRCPRGWRRRVSGPTPPPSASAAGRRS